MNSLDLQKIKSDYELFNVICFNNQLPRANTIDFTIRKFKFACGLSTYNDKPNPKTGNHNEIGFSIYHDFTLKQMREILIHEMIHLWQQMNVSFTRYKVCTHAVAHDSVFISKMRTINLILKKKDFDLEIKPIFDERTKLTEFKNPSPFYVLFFTTPSGEKLYVKTWLKRAKECVDNYMKLNTEENLLFKEAFLIKTTSRLFNLSNFTVKPKTFIQKAVSAEDESDIYELFKQEPGAIWIMKDGQLLNYNIP